MALVFTDGRVRNNPELGPEIQEPSKADATPRTEVGRESLERTMFAGGEPCRLAAI